MMFLTVFLVSSLSLMAAYGDVSHINSRTYLPPTTIVSDELVAPPVVVRTFGHRPQYHHQHFRPNRPIIGGGIYYGPQYLPTAIGSAGAGGIYGGGGAIYGGGGIYGGGAGYFGAGATGLYGQGQYGGYPGYKPIKPFSNEIVAGTLVESDDGYIYDRKK
ncbi:uncharacterized protein LOC142236571 [Haematobia irritans]|uniref:uncharacterized protein LOC142236571 n=1 Tax=Haematobia irritans TaxID=7368 RepID=UPI003F4F4CEC